MGINNILSRVYRKLQHIYDSGCMKLYGVPKPPPGTDLVGYEALIKYIRKNDLLRLPGHIIEIGTFLGGGAYKLSKYLEKKGSTKSLYVIDVFDINFDKTVNVDDVEMSALYQKALHKYGGKSQLEIFLEVTRDCSNLCVIRGDSMKIDLPINDICFAFIDGNHDSSYVENDFYLIWNKLVSHGVISFHDYLWDLPNVTEMINTIITKNQESILGIHHDPTRHIIYIAKK